MLFKNGDETIDRDAYEGVESVERRYPVVELKEIVAALKEAKLASARPWMPISNDYLTVREFLSLIGLYGKRKEYRLTIRHLSMASTRNDSNLPAPEYLKECFREGMVCVHLFRGSPKGTVAFEYRIPVKSLDEKYAGRAKTLTSARNGNIRNSIILSRQTFKGLTLLSARTGKSMSETVEEMVDRELKLMFATEEHP